VPHRAIVCLALVLTVAAPSARGQTAAEQLQYGIEAYRNLELEAAIGFLRRALEAAPETGLSTTERTSALSYLGAAELFSGNRDLATDAFRRLVVLDPRHRLDAVVFPPQVLQLYDDVRRRTRVVMAVAPADTAIVLGRDNFTVRLYAATYHWIRAQLIRDDGSILRPLYDGEVGDSLLLHWDGLDDSGRPAAGRYTLLVESLAPSGGVERIVHFPVEAEVVRLDTLPHPPPPADSLLLPERQPAGPALRSLTAGLALGGLAVALPSLAGSSAEASDARFAVGGAITLAGVIGFFKQKPGRPLPDNIAANQQLLGEWRDGLDTVVRENDARRDARMRIRTGPAVREDLETP
jgi:hypothetical protein